MRRLWKLSGLVLIMLVLLALPLLAEAAPAAPRLKTAAWNGSGVSITWTEVSGAGQYEVWRSKYQTKNFTKIATVTGSSYTDKSAAKNTVYHYKVRAAAGSSAGAFSATAGAYTANAPAMTKAARTDGRYELKWSGQTGAAAYVVYRAPAGSTSYAVLARVSSGARSYVDTTAVNGESWSYCLMVKHAGPDGKWGSTPMGKAVTAAYGVAQVKGLKASAGSSAGTVQASWSAVTNAKSYQVYVRVGENRYKIGETAQTSGTFTCSYTGNVYVYVRAVGKMDGKTVYGKTSAVQLVKLLARPWVTLTLTDTPGSVKVRWMKTEGADGYMLQIIEDGAKRWITTSENTTTLAVSEHGLLSVKALAYYDEPDGTRVKGAYGSQKSILADWGTCYAVLVGNSDYYGTGSDLDGPPNDLAGMSNLLKRFPNVRITTVPNATGDHIRSAISYVFGQAGAHDTCLFYYTGHGNKSQYAESSYNGALVGVDFDIVSVAEVRSLMDAAAPSVPKIVLLDSCLSGHYVEDTTSNARSVNTAPPMTAEQWNDSVIEVFSAKTRASLAAGGYYVLTAATVYQSSWERPMNSGGYYDPYNGTLVGYYTFWLTYGSGYNEVSRKAMSTAPADKDGNGYLGLQELYSYVRGKTSDRQTARVYPLNCPFILWSK